MAENWELGSNYSQGIGGVRGLSELAANFAKFAAQLSGPALYQALWDGAEVIKSAIEAQTPVDSGTAKQNVIIYQRKAKTYYGKGVFGSALTREEFTRGEGATALLIGNEKAHAYYMYFVEHGYTPRRKGDIVIRTRAGGRSITKHFRKEDLFFGKSTSKKHGWTRKHFGQAIAKMEATGGGKRVEGKPFMERAATASAQTAIKAVEDRIRAEISRMT